jgi:capsular exopolysaccharide synthesis family protein
MSARERLLPDPGEIWRILRLRIRIFIVALLLVLIATLFVAFAVKPIYESIASVLIEPVKVDPTGTTSIVPGLPADTNVVDTQVRLIGSTRVALGVVRRLHLDRDPDYTREAEAGSVVAPPAAGDDQHVSAQERSAVVALLRNTYVRRAGLTYVIDIAERASSGDKAALIANTFAQEYIALQNAQKKALTETAANFVQLKADQLRQQTLEDDTAVQRYMIQHNLESSEGATIAEQEVSQLNQQVAAAQATLAQEQGRYQAALGQVHRGGGGADVNAVLSSTTTQQLRSQEATISGQLATLEAHYGPLHPDVIKAKSQLDDVHQQIGAERARILSGLRANVVVAQSGLGSLQASLGRARGTLVGNTAAQAGLLDLQRKAEASKTVYAAFLQRAKEAQAQAQAPLADASVSAVARSGELPVWPNIPLAVLFAIVGGVIVGVLAVAVAQYLDSSVRTREDVERYLGIDYAGTVPDLGSVRRNSDEPPEAYVLSHPHSSFAEALRKLAAFLTLRSGTPAKVIAVTSALPREGKTTLAIAMARTLARSGNRVILVDGDLRRHSASELIDPAARENLLGALNGTIPLAQALIKDPYSDLRVLTTKGDPAVSSALQPEQVAALFEALRQEADLIIVDTAPVLGLAETQVLTRAADTTVLLCRWGKTSAKAARAAADVLEQSQSEFAGVALTMVDSRQLASTGYGDAYGYHKKFTGYYVD